MKQTGTDINHIKPGIPGILLLSHGPLADGLLKSLNVVYGDADNVAAFQLEEGDNPEEYRKKFVQLYEAMPDKSIFLIDLFGGSPFNQMMTYFLKKGTEIRALCGVNLGMLMQAVAERDDEDSDFLEHLAEAGREAVIDVGMVWKERQEA